MERRIARCLSASAALLTLAAFAGCASSPGAAPRVAPDPVAQSLANSRTNDGAITRDVQQKLARTVPSGEIAVSTSQGKVELSGQVSDADEARRAVKNALAVEGVRGVVNDLDVAPEGSPAPATVVAAESLSAAATL